MAGTRLLSSTASIIQIDNRLTELEKYGIYSTLSDLKKAAADITSPYTLLTQSGRVEYSYILGDFTGKTNDVDFIALDAISVSVGCLVRQKATGLTTKSPGSGALDIGLEDLLYSRVNLRSFSNLQKDTDITDGLNRAIESIDTSEGRGGVIEIPVGRWVINGNIKMKDRVHLRGASRRGTIFSLVSASSGIVFDSVEDAGMSNLRLGLSSPIGISIKTTQKDVSGLRFSDIEIAGDRRIGQTGLHIQASNGRIIVGCHFDRMDYHQIDRPIFDHDSEGNFHRSFTIDQFGYSIGSAIDSRGLVNEYTGRIAGGAPGSDNAVVTGCFGYKDTGHRNRVDIVVDIRDRAQAVDLSGANDTIMVIRRPELLTPLGLVGLPGQNTVIDTETHFAKRLFRRGTELTSNDFSLDAGWGSTATISMIRGSDQRCRFLVTAGGLGISSNPRVYLTFKDGRLPLTPIVQVVRDGGNDLAIGSVDTVSGIDGWNFAFGGLPVSGHQYGFIVTTE